MLGVFVYIFNHLDNHVSVVRWTLKVILKNSFIPPLPYKPTSHHKNRSPFFILNTMQLMIDILKDPVPAIKRKKLEIWFKGTNLIHIWVVNGQSLNIWVMVSSSLSHLENVGDAPILHTSTVISERSLMSCHPHKSLNYTRSFPTPQCLPISLDGLSYRILRIIGTLNCEIHTIGTSQPIFSCPSVSLGADIVRTCKAKVYD